MSATERDLAAARDVCRSIRTCWVDTGAEENCPGCDAIAAAIAAGREPTTAPPPAGIPRRACLWLLTPAEEAIRQAVSVVEEVGADPLLTKAVILLGQARDAVADYVDRPSPALAGGTP